MTQLTLLVAVHGHPVAVLMLMLPDAPADPTETTPGWNDSAQVVVVGGAGDGFGVGDGVGAGDGSGCGVGFGVGDGAGVGDDGAGVGDEGGGVGVRVAPDCVTSAVLPAIIIVADRGDDDELTGTVYPIVPGPRPLVAPSAIQPSLLDALHAQSLAVVTVKVPVTPSAGADTLVGAIV